MLPDDQREALILIGVAGLSYEEAAEICDCAEGTIKSRIRTGLTRLRAQLVDRGIDGSWIVNAIAVAGNKVLMAGIGACQSESDPAGTVFAVNATTGALVWDKTAGGAARDLSISGHTVVITGAASGIGRALAQRLSAHGCPVAIADVDERGLKETESSINGPTLTKPLDVLVEIGVPVWRPEGSAYIATHGGSRASFEAGCRNACR